MFELTDMQIVTVLVLFIVSASLIIADRIVERDSVRKAQRAALLDAAAALIDASAALRGFACDGESWKCETYIPPSELVKFSERAANAADRIEMAINNTSAV